MQCPLLILSQFHSKVKDDLRSHADSQTDWTVENDVKCKRMVAQAGGQLVGYNIPVNKVDWLSMCGKYLQTFWFSL